MTDMSKPWDGELVRKWLARRFEMSRLDQAAADRRGRKLATMTKANEGFEKTLRYQ